MKLFHFSYFANNELQGGELMAASKRYVEKMILRVHPDATNIHIWN